MIRLFDATGGEGLEGIASKRVDSPYLEGRSRDWVKSKHATIDEFLEVGYSAPQGARNGSARCCSPRSMAAHYDTSVASAAG